MTEAAQSSTEKEIIGFDIALADFTAWHRSRAGQDQDIEVLRACCAVVAFGPHEWGVDKATWTLAASVGPLLVSDAAARVPEAAVCAELIAVGTERYASGTAEAIAKNAAHLWEPVRILALRALAGMGYREVVATSFDHDRQSMTAALADLWLEGAWRGISPRPPNVVISQNSYLPETIQQAWARLLAAECSLAVEATPVSVESVLEDLTSIPLHGPNEAAGKHIAARALSALVRAQIGSRRHDQKLLDSAVAGLLPVWERTYLSALVRFAARDLDGAIDGLRAALAMNPLQSPIRLALAAALAPKDAEASLEVLSVPNPTRQILVSRAALLARLGKLAEAEQELGRCGSPSTPSEPMRYSWGPGMRQFRLQEQSLRCGIAELAGRWDQARRAWKLTCAVGGVRPSLDMARRMHMSQAELASSRLPSHERIMECRQLLQEAWQKIGRARLIGTDLFFRAVAATRQAPQQAAQDFSSLFRQKTWVEAERTIGGARLIAALDFLGPVGLCHFVRSSAEDWDKIFPVAPEPFCRRLASRLCDEQRWDEVLQLAAVWEISRPSWARQLAHVMRARHALGLAVKDPVSAGRQLRQLLPSPKNGRQLGGSDVSSIH